MGHRGLGIGNLEPGASGELDWLQKALSSRSGNVVIDVGANDGHYAEAIKSIDPSAEVYAIEPHPVTFQRLSLRAERLKVKAFQIGLSNQPGTLQLYDHEANGTQLASVYREVLTELHQSRHTTERSVKVTTLDQFVEEQKITQVDLLKIDTEGHELAVLEGARACLERGFIRQIHFEFNEMNAKSRVHMEDFVHCLHAYTLYRLLPDSMIELPHAPVWREIYAYQNIVAIQKPLV